MQKIYFVSGHLDITEDEFEKYYIQKINDAVSNNCAFVIGDARGTDSFAQKYLHSMAYDKVTIYHMCDKPRNNFGTFKTIGGFNDDDTRDTQMTRDSTNDILWIRPIEEQKKRLGKKYNPNHISGTQKNMIRRMETKN